MLDSAFFIQNIVPWKWTLAEQCSFVADCHYVFCQQVFPSRPRNHSLLPLCWPQ